MHSGNAAAMPLVRNAATLSFCHASRSVRITTAILVSNCMGSPRHSGMRPLRAQTRNPEASSNVWIPGSREGARPGMTLALGVAGPGADHAFLAAKIVAFFGRGVQRGGDLGFDRVAVGAAGVGHVDGKRRAGPLHGHRGALALALLARGGECGPFGRIIDGLAIGAAFADGEGASG